MLSSETQGRRWIPVKIDTIRANGHAKLTVYELFMRGSWEFYEWLMSRRRVANAAQPLILDFFTSFNYHYICRIICFRDNTLRRNSFCPLMNFLESRTRLSYSSGIPNISNSWVTSQNITAGVAFQKKHLWEAAAPVIWLCIHGVWQPNWHSENLCKMHLFIIG